MAALARRTFLKLVTIFALVISLAPGPVAAQSLLGEPRYAAVLVDAASGEVVYSQRADSTRYPASITKMMTLYLTFEALQSGRLSMDDTVLVSPRAAAQPPSRLGLRAGETLTVRDAIFALAIKSANDIAVAMAERIGGTEPQFAEMMTAQAQELGMRGTHYVNASGLPDSRQITNARDIAVLARALMRDFPQHYHTFGTLTWTFRGRVMNNHNHLLGVMAGVDGIKTGFTNSSGYNLAASAVRGNRRLIAVVLGGPSGRSRDAQTRQLLETGFSLYARRDAGERIQFASNLFETPAAGSPVGSVVQGSDADDDDGDAVAAVLNNASAAAPVMPSPRRALSAPRAAPPAPAALAASMQPILEPGDRAPAPAPPRPAAPRPTPQRAVVAETEPLPTARSRAGLRGEQREAQPTRLARRDDPPATTRDRADRRSDRADDSRPSSRRGRDDRSDSDRGSQQARRGDRGDDSRASRQASRADDRGDTRRGGRDDDRRNTRLARNEDDSRPSRRGGRDDDRGDSRQASRERGGFTVQVGAFGNERDAQRRISEVSRHLGGADSAVSRADRGQFRARFNGLTEAQARAACRRVSGPCMVVGAT